MEAAVIPAIIIAAAIIAEMPARITVAAIIAEIPAIIIAAAIRIPAAIMFAVTATIPAITEAAAVEIAAETAITAAATRPVSVTDIIRDTTMAIRMAAMPAAAAEMEESCPFPPPRRTAAAAVIPAIDYRNYGDYRGKGGQAGLLGPACCRLIRGWQLRDIP